MAHASFFFISLATHRKIWVLLVVVQVFVVAPGGGREGGWGGREEGGWGEREGEGEGVVVLLHYTLSVRY